MKLSYENVISEYSLPVLGFIKSFIFLDNVIVRENIKGMFSLFYHLANIMETQLLSKIKERNILPISIQAAESLAMFKKHLKTHLFRHHLTN